MERTPITEEITPGIRINRITWNYKIFAEHKKKKYQNKETATVSVGMDLLSGDIAKDCMERL